MKQKRAVAVYCSMTRTTSSNNRQHAADDLLRRRAFWASVVIASASSRMISLIPFLRMYEGDERTGLARIWPTYAEFECWRRFEFHPAQCQYPDHRRHSTATIPWRTSFMSRTVSPTSSTQPRISAGVYICFAKARIVLVLPTNEISFSILHAVTSYLTNIPVPAGP